ncbi:S-type Pyocin family protein [Klebsiella sp. GB_Kp056]|uniref:S-type Pyocin family protein n=1 Tax=Klebsiella TaxID=570 RepID=UPI00236CA2B3|nr:S-type Pyocin family protein [Klebsiella quasipneumoniae]
MGSYSRGIIENEYPEDDIEYINKQADKVAAVVLPTAVHQKCSETYGGRNNSKVQAGNGETMTKKELDASDLEAAVNSNWDANAECHKNEYGMSDEKIEEIRDELHKLNRLRGLY